MKKYLFEQYAATRLFGAAAYSPDGKTIAYVANTTGQFNLWTVPSGGGFARQLTSFTDNTIRDIRWSPDGKTIAFNADTDGDEFVQIFLIDADGGWARRLTDKLDARFMLSGWTPDGKGLLFSATDREATEVDPVVMDIETGDFRRLMTGSQFYAGSYSPDGQYISVIDMRGNTDQNIFIVEEESGEAALVTPYEEQTIFYALSWKPDSSGFFMLSNAGREFNNIAFYDMAQQKWDWFFTPEHDIDDLELSKDGSTMIMLGNDGGRSVLYGWDMETGERLDLPDLAQGVARNLSVNHDGSKALMIFTSAREAGNLYEVDLKNGTMKALDQSMLGGVDSEDMVEPELIHYPTFDGKEIPAWLYKPAMAGAQFPVVLSIHGGPESQERPQYNYNGLYQYLLNRGIGILAPNIRGSSGYGISYQKLIHRDWGGDELKDIEYAARYLQSLGWVDAARIGVFGGSFGGFATLSAVTRLPDYWAVGVDVVGPSNLVTFVKSVPPHWRSFMASWVGDAEADYDMLIARSPITYVDRIKAPLLVIQGAKDPRVVQAESDQMVAKMRENGLDVTYYVDENEGHGATRRENSIKWMKMIAEYLESRLLTS